uniref:Uncharacterized protein n=1 Tax=Arundo donax TaxID=35708 RepID=A0A0A9FRV1_ARUDO
MADSQKSFLYLLPCDYIAQFILLCQY